MTVHESSGSVLDDLFEPEEAADLKLKAALARRIRDVMGQRKLTQKQAATLTGLRQPDVSKIGELQVRGDRHSPAVPRPEPAGRGRAHRAARPPGRRRGERRGRGLTLDHPAPPAVRPTSPDLG